MLVSPLLSGSVLVDLSLLALAVYLFFAVRSYNKLRHIPGPKLWSWTLLPLMKTHLDGEIYEKFGELNKQYGPLVRIAPNTLLVSDPEILRRMNSARTSYTRSQWYVAMRLIPGKDNVLSTLSDVRHDELRRKMAFGYSGKENVSLETDIDDCVRELVHLFESKYVTQPGGEAIQMDLAVKLQYFTSDVMSKLSFDAKFNDLRDDTDNLGYINEVETVFPSIFCTCVIPAVLEFLTHTGILQMAAPSDSSKLGFGKVLAICKEQVAKRFDSDGKLVSTKKDMLGSFLRNGLSRQEVEQEAVLQLAAGSDTTATGLRGTMLGLIKYPQRYARLQAEIDAAMLSRKISTDYNSVVSDEQARKLPYLQACIKEGLRWWVPIAGMLPKKTPPEGDTVNGYFVPGGVSMAYNALAVHHNPALFGPDEDDFRPERWIHTSEGGDESSREKIKAIEENNKLIFGYGKYQCLGKDVAMIELNKVITEVVRRFDMTLTNVDKPWDTTCYGIHLQKNLWVTLKKREQGVVKEKS